MKAAPLTPYDDLRRRDQQVGAATRLVAFMLEALQELFGPETAERKILDSLITDEEEGAEDHSRPLDS